MRKTFAGGLFVCLLFASSALSAQTYTTKPAGGSEFAQPLQNFDVDVSATLTAEQSTNAVITNVAAVPPGVVVKPTASATEVGHQIHFSHDSALAFFGFTVQPNTGDSFIQMNGSVIDDTGYVKSTDRYDYLILTQIKTAPAAQWLVSGYIGDWKDDDTEPLKRPLLLANLVVSLVDVHESGTNVLSNVANSVQEVNSIFTATLQLDASTHNVGDSFEIVVRNNSDRPVTLKPGAGESIRVPLGGLSEVVDSGSGGIVHMQSRSRLRVTLESSDDWRVTDVEGSWKIVDTGKALTTTSPSYRSRTTENATETIDEYDHTVHFTSTGNIFATLAAELEVEGRRVTLNKTTTTGNTVTVGTASAATVEGGSTFVWARQGGAVTLEYTASGWWVVNAYIGRLAF